MLSPEIEKFESDIPAAYVANGFVGLTVPLSPFEAGEARITGCFGLGGPSEPECIASVPFPVGWNLRIAGIDHLDHAAAFRGQKYDFSTGELSTRLAYSIGGAQVTAEDLLFCSRTLPSIVARRLTLTGSADCSLVVEARVDAGRARGSMRRSYAGIDGVDWIAEWETDGGFSSAGVAVILQVESNGGSERERIEPTSVRCRLELPAGGRAVLTLLASLVPGRLHRQPHLQALRLVRSAAWRGFEAVRKENVQAWHESWKSRLVLRGAGREWQDIADSAFFYLLSSSHESMATSIPPFGLSSSGYFGHVFWDTETFMYPVLLLAAPEAARAALRYRVDSLPSARANALLGGYRGAMFPWESGASGGEVTPVWAATSEEHHVTLDVAFACLQYIWAGSDRAFMQERLWPLLVSVCRWIESRVVRTARGCEIRNVIGIDEGLVNVDNNAYTNIAAKLVLQHASAYAVEHGITAETDAWMEIAGSLFIPVDNEKGIILKHDLYRYEGGPCIPETLAAFFPLTYRHPDTKVEEATYDFHLGLADTVLHFPMLSSLFGVWAARRGMRAKSLEYFGKGIRDFVCRPYMSFSEWRGGERPMFLTNPAGFLTGCIYGLTGIQLDSGDPQKWGKYPVVLPEGWEAVEVQRCWIRGRQAHLEATHGSQHAEIKWLE